MRLPLDRRPLVVFHPLKKKLIKKHTKPLEKLSLICNGFKLALRWRCDRSSRLWPGDVTKPCSVIVDTSRAILSRLVCVLACSGTLTQFWTVVTHQYVENQLYSIINLLFSVRQRIYLCAVSVAVDSEANFSTAVCNRRQFYWPHAALDDVVNNRQESKLYVYHVADDWLFLSRLSAAVFPIGRYHRRRRHQWVYNKTSHIINGHENIGYCNAYRPIVGRIRCRHIRLRDFINVLFSL